MIKKKTKLFVSVSHEMKNKGHDALFVDNKSLNLIDHKQNSACVAVLHSKVFMGKAHVSLQAVAVLIQM